MGAKEILKKYFGYNSFRRGQEELINATMHGQDCLGVMPTGAGKSICFQVPALLLPGVTLVISPLISLMKDQVNALTQHGLNAAFINSTLTERQIYIALSNARAGMYKIIYVAPERLESRDFLDFAVEADISMLTVDEAHCISQWGQDFRPSYLKIVEFLQTLPKRPVVSAYTATATQQVRDDIIKLLQLRNPEVLVTGFDRQNLFFQVERPDKKKTALFSFLDERKDKSGIIYCATRKTVDSLHSALTEKGYAAATYHAGLPDQERHNNQEDFLHDRVRIMVATNAFGMGIDKSNVSFVVHYNMPKDVESYYQEAGRAGRDGEPADCLLLYSGQDIHTQLFLIDKNEEADAEIKDRDRKRLKEMTYYSTTYDCLRGYILKYFGEQASDTCDSCSNCKSTLVETDITVDAQKILSCVIKSKERYGVSTIISVLRGSKNEKIMRFGLHTLSTYDISELSERRLRDIITHLVLHGFLRVTDGKYPILQRGKRADEILRKGLIVKMKLAEDTPPAVKNMPEKRAPINKQLFDHLRDLRMKIANKRSVPAFVIFSDSTLTDMCAKIPASEEEFLNVSGVGQVKLEQFGKQFLDAIADFMQRAGQYAPTTDVYEPSFSDIEISAEPVAISVLSDKINCVRAAAGQQKLSAQKMNDILVEQGYLQVLIGNSGQSYKVPTIRGGEAGITSQERIIRGEKRFVNTFDQNAQRLVLDMFSIL